jgi:hypothetical protein
VEGLWLLVHVSYKTISCLLSITLRYRTLRHARPQDLRSRISELEPLTSAGVTDIDSHFCLFRFDVKVSIKGRIAVARTFTIVGLQDIEGILAHMHWHSPRSKMCWKVSSVNAIPSISLSQIPI